MDMKCAIGIASQFSGIVVKESGANSAKQTMQTSLVASKARKTNLQALHPYSRSKFGFVYLLLRHWSTSDSSSVRMKNEAM